MIAPEPQLVRDLRDGGAAGFGADDCRDEITFSREVGGSAGGHGLLCVARGQRLAALELAARPGAVKGSGS